MSNVIPVMSFEQKLKDRIKDSISDLMTDDDLSKLVHKATEEIFFTKRTRANGSGYGGTVDVPPLIHEIVKEALEEKIKAQTVEWVKGHEEQVNQIIKDVVTSGAGACVMAAMSNMFNSQFTTMQMNIENSLRNGWIR